MSPEVQNRGISGPTKRTHVLQKILKSLSLTSKCPISVERTVLDLESEVMSGLGSIPTRGNILLLEIFVFT